MQGNGFLAIWSDVSDAQLTDYLHWLTREHTAERMGVQGFVAVRVFRAILDNVNRFLIVYELEGPEALSGKSYLDRLNDPTPWSQRIMPILQNFVRGGGYRKLSRGNGSGGYLAALPCQGALSGAVSIADALVAQDRVSAVHLLETDKEKTSIQTDEKKLRGEDRSFDSLLLVEGLDQSALRGALTKFPQALPAGTNAADLTLYSLMFTLSGCRWS